MKAAIFHGPHEPLTIEDVEIDAPMPREILVRTVASGVCHSDLHFVDGLYPMPAPAILGHEAAGIVEAVGEHVSYVKPGDHVIACLSVFCGACEQCMTGHPNRCTNLGNQRAPSMPPKLSQSGTTVHQFANISGYAEKMLLHENAVVKIREDIPLDRAALIGCGVMTGVGAALNTAKVAPGSTVAVFGAGGVGLSAIQGARIAGARKIIAVDMVGIETRYGEAIRRDAHRRRVVARRGAGGEGPHGRRRRLFVRGDRPQEDGRAVVRMPRPGGVATIIGMIPFGTKIELDGWSFLQGEKRIQGSMMGSNRFRVDMPHYIEFYGQGRLKLDEMISKKGRLEDVNEAFRAMKAGEVARTVLMFD